MIADKQEVLARAPQYERVTFHLALAIKPKSVGRKVVQFAFEIGAALALEVFGGVLPGDVKNCLWLVFVKELGHD